jgi:hypothetical protein
VDSKGFKGGGGPSTSGFWEVRSDIRSPRLWNDGEFSYTFCEAKERVSVFREAGPCSPPIPQHTGIAIFLYKLFQIVLRLLEDPNKRFFSGN